MKQYTSDKTSYRMIDRKPNVAAKVAAATGLSLDDLEKLCLAAASTWAGIGHDVLACNDGKDIPRDQVVEVVMDADHILTNNDQLPATVKAILKGHRHSDLLEELFTTCVFTFKRYGL